jgi:hypothetical protein
MPRMPEFGSWGSSEDRDLVVNDVRPGEDWRPLGAFNCEGPLRALEVKCDWWGFTTARVRISLQRDGTSVSTEDVFGPCGRLQRGDVALRRFTQTEELVSLAQAGDEFKVDYRMGGQLPASPGPAAARGRQIQGGALKIKYFEAIPEYQTETMTA